MAKPRRFEFIVGTSNKFWEIGTTGATVRVRFGRIGSTGRESEESFASAKEAAGQVEKAVREKLAKGYQEVGGAAAGEKKAVAKKLTKKPASSSAKIVAKAGSGSAGMRDLLARLEAALRRRHPEMLAKLKPGANEAAIARLQKLAGGRLPASFYEFLRWHDGSRDSADVLDGLVWLSASDAVKHKKMMDGIVEEGHYAAFADDEWWSTGWFPFADDESGYRSLVIDAHGSFGGQPGQVLSAGAKDSTRIVLAPSFDAWLATFVDIAEKGYLSDEEEEGQLTIEDRGNRLFAKRRGYPRMCQPQTASVASESSSEGLKRPTRGAWPTMVPDTARWLISASGDRVGHWLIDRRGTTVTTWTGNDPGALKASAKKWKDGEAAAAGVDAALRKQLASGFVYGIPGAVGRGEPLCALHVGDGSSSENIDLAPDGRTLVIGTVLAEAMGAKLHLVDVETGRRTTIHEQQPLGGHGQTFIHRVAFGPDGEQIYVQMNAQLWVIAAKGGKPKVLAEMDQAVFNPFVSPFAFDRARARLLYFHKRTVRVRQTGGEELLKITVPKGVCEYREAAISASGRLIALIYRSRGEIYGHEDAAHDKTSEIQIWSVDRAKQLYTLPYKGDNLRRIGFSPDDSQLLLGNYEQLVATDIRTGARAWACDAREWAYSPDGSRLAVIRFGIGVSILNAATRRPLFAVHKTLPWATAHAERHDTAALGYSADGSRLYLGNSGGRAYVWQVGSR